MAKKVLVVDDEKLIVKGIRFSLEHEKISLCHVINYMFVWMQTQRYEYHMYLF